MIEGCVDMVSAWRGRCLTGRHGVRFPHLRAFASLALFNVQKFGSEWRTLPLDRLSCRVYCSVRLSLLALPAVASCSSLSAW